VSNAKSVKHLAGGVNVAGIVPKFVVSVGKVVAAMPGGLVTNLRLCPFQVANCNVALEENKAPGGEQTNDGDVVSYSWRLTD
jgi:hypothetical protein